MEDTTWIESLTGGRVSAPRELVQELWSGFGRIDRLRLGAHKDARHGELQVPGTVIVKSIDPGTGESGHPRGWDSDRGVQRKLRSYRVERTFYSDYARELRGSARVPEALGARETPTGGSLVLEDLDAAGFEERRLDRVEPADIRACLRWLASFHAAFLGSEPAGLWERGTYWHLGTRPDELEATQDAALRSAAPDIDDRLTGATFKTLVHGDAKVANFCFPGAADSDDSFEVAAVDFQYVGGGVGIQDVAYFMGSCMDDEALQRDAAGYLDEYFSMLSSAQFDPSRARAVESEWRELWPWAWADFHRFLAGWAPNHWKLSSFSTEMLESVIG